MPSVLRARLTEITTEARRLARGRPASIAILGRIVDSLSVAALVSDNDGRFVLANDAAVSLTGYGTDELLHLSIWGLTPETKDHEAERLWRAFLEYREQSGEYEIVGKDGRIVTTVYAAQTNVLPGLHIATGAPQPTAKLSFTSITAMPEKAARPTCLNSGDGRWRRHLEAR